MQHLTRRELQKRCRRCSTTPLTLAGYGREHELWQDNVENCEQLVQDLWPADALQKQCNCVTEVPTAALASDRLLQTKVL